MRKLLFVGLVSTLILASCGGKKEAPKTNTDSTKVDSSKVDTTAKVEAPKVLNIVETAMADTNLSILVDLIKAAGLVDTLSDTTRKFTVFAPTNAAFNKLGQKKLDDLKSEAKKTVLTEILMYHVLPTEMDAAGVKAVAELDTRAEKVLKVSVKEDKVWVGNGTVTTADIKAGNGTIHIIDAVLTVPAKKGKAKTTAATTEVKK